VDPVVTGEDIKGKKLIVRAADAGAHILPPMPEFYSRPETI
jgi:3-polyprenyl-4-hydroxybenzoate decarboxylase